MTTAACRCVCCREPLDPPQEFRYLVELQTADTPAFHNSIRQLPSVNGRPLRVCRACQTQVQSDPRRLRAVAHALAGGRREFRSALVTAFGVLSVGWLVSAMFGIREAV